MTELNKYADSYARAGLEHKEGLRADFKLGLLMMGLLKTQEQNLTKWLRSLCSKRATDLRNTGLPSGLSLCGQRRRLRSLLASYRRVIRNGTQNKGL